MSDQFTPATRFLIVACVGRSRYFDLDAVREPYGERTIANNRRAVTEGRHTEGRKGKDEGGVRAMEDWRLTHAGAPPLDYWEIPEGVDPEPPNGENVVSSARFIVGDVFDRLAELPDGSVDLILTSPPFLALRSYLPADHPDKAKEIGSEPTPAAFLDTLLALSAEWRRVLAPHGSLVVELGDTYSGSGGAGGDYGENGWRDGQERFDGSASREYGTGAAPRPARAGRDTGWPLAKSLCVLPHLYAASLAYGRNVLRAPLSARQMMTEAREQFGATHRDRMTATELLDWADELASLYESGPVIEIEPWRVRNVVAWCRPNPPVGALGDKFRPATSYLTVACVGRSRYFDLDAVREPLKHDYQPYDRGATSKAASRAGKVGEGPRMDRAEYNPAGAPPLDYWEIPTAPFAGADYATFPPALCVRPIKAMCPEKVCRVCGKPSERITSEAEYVRTTDGGAPTTLHFREGVKINPTVRSPLSSAGDTNVTRTVETLGWSDCGHDNWRRGHILDPFAGSGTTLAVAVGHGRDATGIDLDYRNADLARERCGMFLTVEEPSPYLSERPIVDVPPSEEIA